MKNLRKKNQKLLKDNHVYYENQEHDACGVGLVASTEGRKSRKVVEYGIEALKAVWHRGAVDADGKTGDGAGIHIEIPQDFFIDMREIYLTYRAQKYELRVGKQIYSWGNVDENSPLDIVSPFDYYYMFYGGTNRKLSNLSLGIDYYLGKLKLYTVLSPIHSTNRLPIGEDDFPIELPIYPPPSSILPIKKNPFESGFCDEASD